MISLNIIQFLSRESNFASCSHKGSNHCAEAIDDDSPDALPKIFRPTAGSVSPEANNAGKGIVQASVMAWSATDVYALPPAYPSMGTVSLTAT